MDGIQAQFVMVVQCASGLPKLIGEFKNGSQLAHVHDGKTLEQQDNYACSLTLSARASATIHA
ncbi:hypothetical protein [Burkholderia gladioli]|uniref:hypothetical protein n=1 Tax=Burkholderia gladioli TaxID=28095 RepID=UPI001FC7F131|nr:hypothetical protein [Burkholderia gladioli]